ncbi:hypothetical protein H5410_018812 [Solanum commersonii]|uniref:Uncharacterized protein n=1 Tax=Solanum commersonii TaxID=4109 RepID=A0A9J6A476_SOLCO|nr:hypothetical protein H5410_018812 [Solanum commersonii]
MQVNFDEVGELVVRQGNKVANLLSRLGFKLIHTTNSLILRTPPDVTKKKQKADQDGVSSSKIVVWSIRNKLARFDNISSYL